MIIPLPSTWHLGFSASKDSVPDKWIAASVPGAVQLDWAEAHGWGPFYIADNWADYRWMEDVYWIYRTRMELPLLPEGSRIVLRSEGIDYDFIVFADGLPLHRQEGMFTPFEVDLTAHSGREVEIEIRISPAPKSASEPEDRFQANRSCKPAVSYGWDFHPRLIPLGIWQETNFAIHPSRGIRSFSTRYVLSEGNAELTVAAEAERDGGDQLHWSLLGPEGTIVAGEQIESGSLVTRVAQPRLWWPHDQGEPALYTSRLVLLSGTGEVIDQREERVGFRTVRLVPNTGVWDEPRNFPKSRSRPPITLEINGRRIFAKGSNWVSPDIFPGRINEATYRPLLEAVRDAHMNILRLWGGAIVQKESFYSLCDELGILVWQEFPLACNEYPDDPGYLKILEQEARSIIRRLKLHPCVVIWCGGNELFNSWSRMTDQSLPLRLLNKICYEEDPGRPFLPTAPLDGMAHGGYFFRDLGTGQEVWHSFQNSHQTAYTEFGCSGPASEEILREIIPADELFPPKTGTCWETHHGVNAWLTHGWLWLPVMNDYFGEPQTLSDLVENGQLLQSEGFRGLYEEARRQKPYASMALSWCLNEPWPTAANNSLISWPCRPKPALVAVSDACRPILGSARIPKFCWQPGEYFQAEIWLLNDAPQPLVPGEIEALLEIDNAFISILSCQYPRVPEGENWCGSKLQMLLPPGPSGTFRLHLRVTSHPEWNSIYTLLRKSPGQVASSSRTMNV